ncbi:hypothetical protein C5C53_07850 [Rathayibacter sp. AY1E3]|uniref:hypothetical protein n=1 Tax=Rathayibacter sp. AY1E3 TaxID=2080551 RepID=UPI000CE889F2|nr:hypothetical protein [Rathayibacter sp. AY1E3]PPH37219.1 hypothetical protein C5C53_07850 [Rathayibacter sp. AY1E3]
MSTSIDVYPSTNTVPTLGEFAAAVHAILIEHQDDPTVVRAFGKFDAFSAVPKVERLTEVTGRLRPLRTSDPDVSLAMVGNDYGWLSVDAIESGFDFYSCSAEDYFEDLPHSAVVNEHAERAKQLGTLDSFPFDDAASVGWCWYMRLQATQPLRTRLLAGLAAAALARITNGLIHSEDGGVDYDRAPTDPETSLSWYPNLIEREMLGGLDEVPISQTPIRER